MSGAPVYHVFDDRIDRLRDATVTAFQGLSAGAQETFEPAFEMRSLWTSVESRLVGLYSARVKDGENPIDKVSLGMVWRFDALQKIFQLPYPPDSGFNPDELVPE